MTASGGRILLVTPSLPYPADSGGSQRTALLIESLGRHGSVDLFVIGATPAEREATARHCRIAGAGERRGWIGRIGSPLLARLSPVLAATIPDPRARRRLAALIEREGYDRVVLRYSATACRLVGLRRAVADGIPILVDVDDALAPAAPGGRLARALRAPIAWYEGRGLRGADGCWTTGAVPAALARDVGPARVDLPNIPYRPDAIDGRGKDAGCVILGVAHFRYGPNRDGFDRFVRRAWPAIRQACPAATLRFVGRPPRPRLAARWRRAGVDLVGRVEDLAPFYRTATIAIAPILRGGGTRIKLIEAAALGIPSVATPMAASGLALGDAVLLAAGDDAFARACTDLLGDPARRAAMGAAGRAAVARHHTKAIFDRRVDELIDAVSKRR